MTGFDSIQVRFKNVNHIPSPLSNTRVVPFVGSYFDILKAVVNDVETEYFWFFTNFVNMATVDMDYIPEQNEKDQLHVWYTTHPKGGLNKEGNVMLIPTEKFKEQMYNIKFLRDFKDINYHPNPELYQHPIHRTRFKLQDPYEAYQGNSKGHMYCWMVNKDLCDNVSDFNFPDFYPSMWEDVKMYSWGKTKDIMLAPVKENLVQFHDIDRSVNFDLDYPVKPMDIIFISYDEPSAEKRFKILKEKYPRAKWCKGITGQTLAYITAATMSETDYFFAVFPKLEIVDSFKFDFQPDRLKNPCHYIFNCKNPVNGLEYGHGAVLLYNKKLVYQTTRPGLDFTLSAAHDWVPELSAINHYNETPWLAWRTAFREVLKLCQNKPTVETQYRLKKWTTVGEGKNGEWSLHGAKDAQEYYQKHGSNHKQLMLSYDFEWLKQFYDTKYQNSLR
tara:strand:- start:838 stop:2172 length:1335 start_codon:yes stop_codon:yes gene_type:complete